MNKKQIIILISGIAVLFWMALIFNLSAQPATQSDKLSKGLTKVIIETVDKVDCRVDFDRSRFNHILRKNAHFFAYLVLGVLVINAMGRSGVGGVRGALFICVLYAMSDEVHQFFVPGRVLEGRMY